MVRGLWLNCVKQKPATQEIPILRNDSSLCEIGLLALRASGIVFWNAKRLVSPDGNGIPRLSVDIVDRYYLNFLIFISIFFIFVLAERKHTAIFHWMFTLYSLNLFEAIFCAFFKGKQRRKLQLLFLDVILIIRIIHLVFLP